MREKSEASSHSGVGHSAANLVLICAALAVASAARAEPPPPPAAAPAAAPATQAAPPPALPAPAAPGPGATMVAPSDAPADAGPPMTLDEATAYAVRNNPRVSEAAAQIREAQAVITQRRAVRRPQVGLGGTLFGQGPVVSTSGQGGGSIQPPLRWSIGPTVSQILFDWGQRAARQREAERLTSAARFQRGETVNDVRLVVSTAFYNVFRSQELLRVARERQASAAEQLRVARARFEADVAPRFDVIRSEAELANADQDVLTAANDLAQSEAAFNTALGTDVVAPVHLQYTPAPPRGDVPFETARQAALKNRPQLAALAETVQAQRQEVRARRAENKPQVGFGADFTEFNQNFRGNANFYEAGLTLNFPFFDSGLTRGRVREAQATADADRARLEQARLLVEQDVRRAQLDITTTRQRIATARIEVTSAREALRVAQVRYRAGVGTNVEVTDAQAELARAGQDLANAQFDYETAVARLENATGVPADTLLPPRTP